ncbi:MAG: class II aldolase/adducin family protein, partial [Candidatus Paceibacterota bacterium]
CVIMENHAAVVGGRSILEALQRLETFELCAGIIINASKLGNYKKLNGDQLTLPAAAEIPVSFTQQEIHSDEEEKLRESMCRFVKRSCRQGLMLSSIGAVSTRMGNNSILITPIQVDRSEIKPGDIVKIKNGSSEPGKIPDSSIKLHLSIYREHPDIRSIMLSIPTYTMAFGVTGNSMDTRTTPESYVLVGDVPLIPFSKDEEKINKITELLSHRTHCMIVENDELVVTGQSLLQTYERLEVVESTAKSIIQLKHIGTASPISETDLKNLESKFLAS